MSAKRAASSLTDAYKIYGSPYSSWKKSIYFTNIPQMHEWRGKYMNLQTSSLLLNRLRNRRFVGKGVLRGQKDTFPCNRPELREKIPQPAPLDLIPPPLFVLAVGLAAVGYNMYQYCPCRCRAMRKTTCCKIGVY